MRSLRIAIGLIEQGDKYVLQGRSGDAFSGARNQIGCFGGQIEDEESAQQALQRELTEETSLSPIIDNLERVGEVRVISDLDEEPVRILAEVFRLIVTVDTVVEAKEGDVVKIRRSDVAKKLHRMTPATRASFNELIFRE